MGRRYEAVLTNDQRMIRSGKMTAVARKETRMKLTAAERRDKDAKRKKKIDAMTIEERDFILMRKRGRIIRKGREKDLRDVNEFWV